MTDENKRKQKYLQQYQWAQKEINNWKIELNEWLTDEIEKKTDELDRWKSKANKLTATLSDMPNGGESLGMDGAIVNYVPLEAEINQTIIKAMDDKREAVKDKIDRALKLIKDIEQIIENVEDGRLRMLLNLRYIHCDKWESICCNMDYSWPTIHILHNKALNMLILR